MKKIYIDAGHGGADSGAVGVGGVKESEINLAAAKLLKTELLRQGFTVQMSRENDCNKTLAERSREANAFGADVVVSVHANAYSDASASGTETYVYKKGYNAEKIATQVQKNLVEALGTKNRGVKEGNLAILRDTDAPAVLCELAFATNKEDCAKLTNAAYRKKAAVAICKGICAYLGVNYQAEPKPITFLDQEAIPSWAKEAVEKVAAKGLMAGDAEGTFRPNDPVTRAELAVILARME